jgi:uncharacterized protein YacL
MVIFRIALIVCFIAAGYLAGMGLDVQVEGALAGMILGSLALVVEQVLKRVSVSSLICGLMGLALGIAAAKLLLMPFQDVAEDGFLIAAVAFASILGYAGLLTGLRRGEKLTADSVHHIIRGGQTTEEYKKLLDTSVIIDGRIADITETGFIEGEFIVPQFILHELQHIADSPDSLKRARGRRGLDILHRMQKMTQINVQITEEDFPKIREVDAKLVALAKKIGAKVITNDFNLNKVAELQGVPVLNINELANAIKPVVLPGEGLKVFIIKEGKEQNQGVAYLEDGTMVVVDNGRRLIGKNIDVTVTSVLQTTAGRMIFTKTREDYEREEAKVGK